MSMLTPQSGFPFCLLLALAGTVLPAPAQPSLPAADTVARHFGASLADEQLQARRGGSEQMKTEMSLSGSTAQNNAEQVYTGSNTISAGSFANASGIPIVIQNSGANVLIQNATILNLQLR